MRNDDGLQKIWTSKRILRDEFSRDRSNVVDFSGDPGRTDKSQAKDCDVNVILKKFQHTGVLPGVNKQAVFADISDVTDYQESLNIVLAARQQFDSLDAFTRKRFGNDPAEFLAFVSDPKNAEELVKMGLATRVADAPVDRIVNAIERSGKAPSKPSKSSPGQGEKAGTEPASGA